MKTDLKFFATVTVAAAALIAGVAVVMLSGKDSNGGQTQTDADREYDAEVVMSHLNYDGLYLNGNTTLNCYDRTGKLKESDIPLDSVMRGGKCLALFSMNSCSDCSRLEMSLL